MDKQSKMWNDAIIKFGEANRVYSSFNQDYKFRISWLKCWRESNE